VPFFKLCDCVKHRLSLVLFVLVCPPAIASGQSTWRAQLTPAYMAEAPQGGWTMGVRNWLDARHRSGPLSADVMLSAEPFTLDTQRDTAHPIVMGAGLTYSLPSLRINAALAGEPALGPPVYLHRASAAYDPVAPATHHLTNGFHAAYSVLTAEVSAAGITVAASAFDSHDRHAETKRVDPHAPDALSARVSLALAPSTRVSVSGASVPASGHGGHAVKGDDRSGIGLLTLQHDGKRIAWLGVVGWHDVGPGIRLAMLEATTVRSTIAYFARVEAADALEERITIVINPDESHSHEIETLRSLGGKIAAGLAVTRPAARLTGALGARASLTWIPENRRELFENKQFVPGVSVFLTITAGSGDGGVHHH
jgi:hypothetical protein